MTVDRPATAGCSTRRRLLFVVNDLGFFLSHRLPVAEAAAADGWEVHVAAPAEGAGEGARDETGDGTAGPPPGAAGLRLHALPLRPHGTNPMTEAASFGATYRLFRRLKPDLVHLVTVKPVIYGGLAARLAGVPAVVSAISGLGYVFSSSGVRAGIIRRVLRPFYRLALGHPRQRVIFQNESDRAALAAPGTRIDARAEVIRGSGVDLDAFAPSPEPEGPVTVMLASRLLREKGIADFVAAARLLRAEGTDDTAARFVVVGDAPAGNPTSIPPGQIDEWRAEGTVEFWGHRGDMPGIMRQAHVVVLPSFYREGLPKVLLEAAASGRPVVTTDWPGCRDAVEPEETGLLVPPRDPEMLARAIRRLLTDAGARRRMGRAGRALAERAFSAREVARRHLEIYRALTDATGG